MQCCLYDDPATLEKELEGEEEDDDDHRGILTTLASLCRQEGFSTKKREGQVRSRASSAVYPNRHGMAGVELMEPAQPRE